MLSFIRNFGILKRVLLFGLLVMIGKPVIGSYINITNRQYFPINDCGKQNQYLIVSIDADQDIEDTEFFEEVEELLEDEESIHQNVDFKLDLVFPSFGTDINVIISSYRQTLYKHINKLRLYIKYSCLKSHILS